ncbi:MAG TPA: AAA family ATPase [Gammaproteobacteria bacterium]|jgi:replicative DNA helicase|nr:AAA family ATPase [Gammaproteobacteria bacterium]MBT7831685.1 AAA family ATPase [Candidatus Neomarinimicrobiota bacterium]MBT4080496.1 AAA family ATPase [Gammaproteobacteria bacterium]MBT4302027.1 AAA family ATPase [Gammaproteobacteria bacterium]MBT5370412.1 AAA family ATPase [Gammaproteobacteria bacterium]
MIIQSSHIAELLELLENDEPKPSLSLASGYPSLDQQFPDWLYGGQLTVVAGRPAMGKTAFVHQISNHIAQDRTSVFVSLEMGADDLIYRAVCANTSLPVHKLRSPNLLTNEERLQAAFGLADQGKLNILVEDEAHSLTAIVQRVEQAILEIKNNALPPLGVIVIDYLQLVSANAANRSLEVGSISRRFKLLAKSLNVPVILVSQLNRGLENRDDKRPILSDLRDSGEIEQDADAVVFIYRDEVYHPKSRDQGIAEVIVAKNRYGSTGTSRLHWIAERATFKDEENRPVHESMSLPSKPTPRKKISCDEEIFH